jgi:hypothetical protein
MLTPAEFAERCQTKQLQLTNGWTNQWSPVRVAGAVAAAAVDVAAKKPGVLVNQA